MGTGHCQRLREFCCPLLCPPMEILQTFEAGGRGGGGKGDWLECLCLSVLVSCVSSALRKLKQSKGTQASMRTKTLMIGYVESYFLFIKIRLYYEIDLGSLCRGGGRTGSNPGLER